MAKVKNQIVPPSLEDGLSAVLHGTKPDSSKRQIISLNEAARRRLPEKKKKGMPAFALDAGRWLQQAWGKDLSPNEQSAFYAARLAEIYNRTFPPTYWHDLLPADTRVGITHPLVRSWVGTENPTYADPNRKQTDCSYSSYERNWTLPPFPTTTGNHSPGFHGEVMNQEFRDIWFAATRCLINLPIEMPRDSLRPCTIKIDMEIHASSTRRGNRVWFSPCARFLWSPTDPWFPNLEKANTHFKQEWKYQGELEPENINGWSQIVTLTKWLYVNEVDKKDSQKTFGSIIIDIGTSPPHGRYFSGNDSITVFHNAQIRLYLPKSKKE